MLYTMGKVLLFGEEKNYPIARELFDRVEKQDPRKINDERIKHFMLIPSHVFEGS